MKTSLSIVAFLGVALSAVGCDEPVRLSNAPARPVVRAGGPAARADAGVDGGADAGPVRAVYRENDFVELGVTNRDPFRDYVISMVATGVVENPRIVKMRDVSLDQMRLIAVITGVPVPYAMIEDPTGVGHWIVRGDYIGREDVVNAGGAEGMPIALNWRVDRIRDGEVVLTREDPLHPDQPPLMRSMTLRDRTRENAAEEGVRSGNLNNTGATPAATTVAAPTPGVLTPPPTPPRSPNSTNGAPTPTPPAYPPPAPTPPASTGTTTGTPARPSIFGQGFSP